MSRRRLLGGATTRNSTAISRRSNEAGPDASALEWPRHFRDTTLHSRSGPESRAGPASSHRRAVLLVIDNYDSFTFNLVQYLGELGADPAATVREESAGSLRIS